MSSTKEVSLQKFQEQCDNNERIWDKMQSHLFAFLYAMSQAFFAAGKELSIRIDACGVDSDNRRDVNVPCVRIGNFVISASTNKHGDFIQTDHCFQWDLQVVKPSAKVSILFGFGDGCSGDGDNSYARMVLKRTSLQEIGDYILKNMGLGS